MNITIELPEESAERLRSQAEARGLSLEAFVEELARERALPAEGQAERTKRQAAIDRILAMQARVRPDPEGWVIRDYIDHGRL